MIQLGALEGNHHLVIPRSGPLVVFFSGTNKEDKSFDFRGYAERIPHSALLLNNGLNRWYQNGVPGFGDSVEGTANMIQAWADHLSAPEIICIGASMGGSAAVMYGSMTSARILAFSFEANVRYIGSRSRKYIPADFPLPYPDLSPFIKRSKHPVISILGGDDVIDVAEANRIKNTPNLELKILRAVDHGVPRFLRNNGNLDDCLNAFIQGQPLPVFNNATKDLEHTDYMTAIMASHEAYAKGDTEQSLRFAQVARAASPTSYCANYLLGQALAKQKQFEAAIAPLSIAAHLAPDTDIAARLILGRAVRSIGRVENAIEIHRRTLELKPNAHRVWYDLSLALWRAGKKDAASGAVAEAIKFGGPLDSYISRQAKYLASS